MELATLLMVKRRADEPPLVMSFVPVEAPVLSPATVVAKPLRSRVDWIAPVEAPRVILEPAAMVVAVPRVRVYPPTT